MTPSSPHQVTELLVAWSNGDQGPPMANSSASRGGLLPATCY